MFAVDIRCGRWCDACVADSEKNSSPLAVNVALCLDGDVFDRFGAVLRHLVVGLVDQAVQVRLVSSDARIESLKLGPVQSVLHPRVVWPVRVRRTEQLIETLASDPPTITHALSGGSYAIALEIADAFDTDVALQVTSVADCDRIAQLDASRVGVCIAMSEPLADILTTQLGMPSERIVLVRPGVRTTAGGDPGQGKPTVLCTAPFEPGSGVDKLIKAAHILHKREHDLLLFLLGEGPKESTLRRLTRDRGLDTRVIFAHPTGDLVQAMRSADIFVHPSEDTALSADGLQAMGNGMAVVSFPNAVCDHYRHEETALVTAHATAESLADSIERLLADRALAQRLSTSGVEYVRTHHAWSGMAERTAATYRQFALNRATFSMKE